MQWDPVDRRPPANDGTALTDDVTADTEAAARNTAGVTAIAVSRTVIPPTMRTRLRHTATAAVTATSAAAAQADSSAATARDRSARCARSKARVAAAAHPTTQATV